MIKKIFVLLLALTLILAFVGCDDSKSQEYSDDVEIVVEEFIVEEDETVSEENTVTSTVTDEKDDIVDANSSETLQTESVYDQPAVEEDEGNKGINTNYDWKSHSQDYKLIALTFDDGPSYRMTEYVQLLAAYEGAGTFFVNGRNIKGSAEYNSMQNAINYGWDIGNHGDQHLVATIGGADGGEATYDELKADVHNLTQKLEANLKKADGTPYEVSIYRAPNIKPTANTFKICDEEKFPVIWLAYDAYDWDTTKDDYAREQVFKNGVTTWEDGDVILCHEVQQFADQTYKNLEKTLIEFYKNGYRFCSVTELMQLRGITREQICGELNNVDGNRGMVTNIVKAAKQGKK